MHAQPIIWAQLVTKTALERQACSHLQDHGEHEQGQKSCLKDRVELGGTQHISTQHVFT